MSSSCRLSVSCLKTSETRHLYVSRCNFIAFLFLLMRYWYMHFWPRPSARSRRLDIGRVLFFTFLQTETKLRSIRMQKRNEANIQLSWLNKLGQQRIYYIGSRFCFNKNQEWLIYFQALGKKANCDSASCFSFDKLKNKLIWFFSILRNFLKSNNTVLTFEFG